jgi:hypothetical protein
VTKQSKKSEDKHNKATRTQLQETIPGLFSFLINNFIYLFSSLSLPSFFLSFFFFLLLLPFLYLSRLILSVVLKEKEAYNCSE